MVMRVVATDMYFSKKWQDGMKEKKKKSTCGWGRQGFEHWTTLDGKFLLTLMNPRDEAPS